MTETKNDVEKNFSWEICYIRTIFDVCDGETPPTGVIHVSVYLIINHVDNS